MTHSVLINRFRAAYLPPSENFELTKKPRKLTLQQQFCVLHNPEDLLLAFHHCRLCLLHVQPSKKYITSKFRMSSFYQLDKLRQKKIVHLQSVHPP